MLNSFDRAVHKKDADVVFRYADRVPYLCVVVQERDLL